MCCIGGLVIMYRSKPALAYPTWCIHGLKSCPVFPTKGTVSIAWVIIIHTRFLTRGQVLFTCPTSITKKEFIACVISLCARRAHRRHPSCRSWYKKRDCFRNPLFHHLHNIIYFFGFFGFFMIPHKIL